MDTKITSAEIANGYLLAETHSSLATIEDALRVAAVYPGVRGTEACAELLTAANALGRVDSFLGSSVS